jgi:hypothetical protein
VGRCVHSTLPLGRGIFNFFDFPLFPLVAPEAHDAFGVNKKSKEKS